jgi:two-component system nitrate/nitrite sensor histidine kinase NarX
MPIKKVKEKFKGSVVTIISTSVFTIIAVMMVAIVISFWMVEKTGVDAQAINTSGSMRMQTYRIGLALQQRDTETLQQAMAQLEETWSHSSLSTFIEAEDNESIQQLFLETKNNWNNHLKPIIAESIANPSRPFPLEELQNQVVAIDQLVNLFQKHSEDKTYRLRLVLLVSMFVSSLIGSVIFYILKERLERPLGALTEAAREIGKGNFDQHLDFVRNDELALLAQTLNDTSHSIAEMQANLENRIDAKTQELRHNNITLNYLFNIASQINNIHENELNIENIVDTLSKLTGIENIELCLMTADGEQPYQQVGPVGKAHCEGSNCKECKTPIKTITPMDSLANHRYPLMHYSEHLGVLSVKNTDPQIEAWKDQLIQSVADQIATALSIKNQANNARRIALMNERSVIARELHDSLAQALSYLQIQVSRLQKNQDRENYDKNQAIIDELREGLSSAYQSLRELLTTFRLKMSTSGLQNSLQEAVTQMQERTDIQINLEYGIQDIPLSPAEEIHLVQIVREASQNAIKHSEGTRIDIALQQQPDRIISVQIADNGVGVPDNPEKLNHYGMAIMRERSSQLNGELQINPNPQGGTVIEFTFSPSIISKSA